jgi:hypothetical protein
MPKVYIPQVPSRYDQQTRLWIPTVNVDPARKFGELQIMLPVNANRLHTAPLIAAMKESMAEFNDQDWIVALGDPSLIAAAACIATRKTGGILKLLKWDRLASDYIAVEAAI